MSSDPEKYGFFATVPDLCDGLGPVLEEVRYAFDELKADGVTLLTRYGNDLHYLGHPDFLPLWDELEKRKAVVYVHPTVLASPLLVNQFLVQPTIDFPHETARTAMDLITRNVIRDHPSVRIILSHAGGTLPYIVFRAAVLLSDTDSSNGKSTEEIMEEARSFYFDLALSSNEYQLPLVSRFAKPGHLLFGSDFPFAPNPAIDFFTNNLDKFEWSAEERKAANWGNALKLFPRFAGVSAGAVRSSRIMKRA
jgi:predicted TIM-barrel fold metal-dependent hydrolase